MYHARNLLSFWFELEKEIERERERKRTNICRMFVKENECERVYSFVFYIIHFLFDRNSKIDMIFLGIFLDGVCVLVWSFFIAEFPMQKSGLKQRNELFWGERDGNVCW